MRIFLAGATGVLGVRLVPLLVQAGHTVAGMTRSVDKARLLENLGAEAVVCDVYDAVSLDRAVREFAPDLVLHELTDLPDDVADIPAHGAANARIRIEGTRNLIDATRASGCERFIAQSIAWSLPPGMGADAVEELERRTLEFGGVVLRYGQFYGPGTFHPDDVPDHPRIHLDEAARLTVEALGAPSGVIDIVER